MAALAMLLGLALWAPMALSATAEPAQDAGEAMRRPPWEACRYCHGPTAGDGIPPIPAIDGLSEDYIAKQLTDFRSGKRSDPSAMMSSALVLLDPPDDRTVANYFSHRQAPEPVNAGRHRDGARLYRNGRTGVPACVGCHGLPDPPANYPRLLGQGRAYLAEQMAHFRQGTRRNDPGQLMRNIASALTPEETTALVDYLAGR
jgi:cytochrome c553